MRWLVFFKFFKKCIEPLLKIVGENAMHLPCLTPQKEIYYVGIRVCGGGSWGGGGSYRVGDGGSVGLPGCAVDPEQIPLVDGPCWGSSRWVCNVLHYDVKQSYYWVVL